MKRLICAFIIGYLFVSGSVQAYPGMQHQKAKQSVSTVDQITVLPKAYPIDAVPFKNKKGESVDFSAYRGKVILVNVWATWCPPCVRELPAIDRFESKVDSKDFAVLPVSIDQAGKKVVEPFLAKLKLAQFSTFYDKEQSLSQVFPLDTIPATFILNRKGQLIAYARTYIDWDDQKAVELINRFLDTAA